MSWNKGLDKSDSRVSSYIKLGKEHSQWKGGFAKHSDGYFYIHQELIEPAFYPMLERTKNYLLYHRYVMAKHLGRCLKKGEIVHHIDHDKNNNDIANLEIASRSTHMKTHHPELISLAQKACKVKRSNELIDLNSKGIITAKQAADILGVPHSTIRRRQERELLSDIATKYNGRCLYKIELTENSHL